MANIIYEFERTLLEMRKNSRRRVSEEEKPTAVIAALAADIAIALVKFIAAGITRSSAMLSEGIHSLVDSSDAILILYGIKSSEKKHDLLHPFGYGKQIYFFSFVVSLCIFSMGGVVSIFKGIDALVDADSIVLGDPTLNYIVCFIAMIIEGSALVVTIKAINLERGKIGLFTYIHHSKDPSTYIVLFEDATAELGLIAAVVGIFLSQITGNPRYDAVASIVIGLLLMAVALVLLLENKSLLIGEGLTFHEVVHVSEIVEKDKNTNFCGRILSLYMGPRDLLITIDVNFKDNTTNEQILDSIQSIEKEIMDNYPEANRIFIEPVSHEQLKKQMKTLSRIKVIES